MGSFGLAKYLVNTASLGLYVTDTLFYHKGLGPGIDITISYNSQASNNSTFGSKWSFAYETLIEELSKKVVLTKGSGQKLEFIIPEGSQYPIQTHPSAGRLDKLIGYEDYWLFQEKGSKVCHRYDKVPSTTFSMLTAILDRNGNANIINYNRDGTIKGILDAAGRELLFTYNDQGYCTSFTLVDGRKATFTYNSLGNLVKSVDFEGVESCYEYDSEGYLLKMVLGQGQRTTIFNYLDRGNHKTISSVKNARGNITSYEMTSINPRIVKVTDPEGKTTFYQSTHGLTERVTDAAGNYTVTNYENGLPISYKNKRGYLTKYMYDNEGNLLSTTDYMGNVHELAYDKRNNIISETDALDLVKTFSYDERDNLIKVALPSGAAITYEYTQRGQVSKINLQGNKEVSFTYDDFGNMERVTNAEGVTTTYTYQPYGYTRKSIIDTMGSIHLYEYDNNNRQKKYVYPDGSRVLNAYDCCAGILTIDENGNAVSYERDELSNVVKVIDPLENYSQYFYDKNNRMIKTIDPAGRIGFVEYDNVGLPIKSCDALGNQTFMSYDEEGNLISFSDAIGQKLTYEYDGNSLPIKLTNNLGGVIHHKRDALGRLEALINARGNKISYVHDTYNRIVKKDYDDKEIFNCEYDDENSTEKITDAWGYQEFTFNKNDQPVAIKYPDGNKAFISYTPLAYVDTMAYGDDLLVKYHYDKRSRVTRVEWKEHFIEFTHDAVGNVLSESRSNGTKTLYTVNSQNLLMEITHKREDIIFAQIKVERDILNNIITEDIISPVGLPAIADTDSLKYDMSFDLISKAMHINNEKYTYDGDGNLTGNNVNWNADYDYENRPIEIILNGDKRRFTYDCFGQRVIVAKSTEKLWYHFDTRGRLLFETDDKEEVLRSYIYSGRQLLAMIKKDGTVLFYHFNMIGSTVALTNEQGEVAAAYAYEPYGRIAASSGDTKDNIFTFVGAFGVMDEGNGLYFMKSRYYHAQTGRFIQYDPIGISGGSNLYSYAAGNPLKFIDPDGTNLLSLALTYKVLAGIGTAVGAGIAYYKYKQAKASFKSTMAVKQQQENNFKKLIRSGGDTNAYYKRHDVLKKDGRQTFGDAIDSGKDAISEGVETVVLAPLGPAGDAITIGKEVLKGGGGTGDNSSSSGAGSSKGDCFPPSGPSVSNMPEEIDWSTVKDPSGY